MDEDSNGELELGQLKRHSRKLKIKQVWLRILSGALLFSNNLTPDKRITLWFSAPFLPAAIIFTLVSLITGALLIAVILAGVWAVVVGLFILLVVALGDIESVQRDFSKTSEKVSELAPQIDELEQQKTAYKAAQRDVQEQKKPERSVLGFKQVKVRDLVATISPPRKKRRPSGVQGSAASIADIEVIPEYHQVCRLISAEAPLIFVTGGAGTGKSTLIRYLRNKLKLNIAVVAPTGVAALNAGGVTIHSLFRLPPKIIQPDDVKEVYDRQLYRALDLLIVDEVSMVRPDLLDGVDLFLRRNRNNNAPFGGVRILLIGDLFQLPPVAPGDDRLVLRSMNYATDFFFSSSGIADCSLASVVLRRVFRQTDPSFISLLNNIRESKCVIEALRAINARCVGYVPSEDHELVLTCTNRVADERNRQEISRLTSAPRMYAGSIKGNFRIEKTRLPSPLNLDLKPGAQVMFTKNDAGKRWVNGTIGKVMSLGKRTAKVAIEHESLLETVEVEPVTWEQYKYEYDPIEDRIVAKVVGSYTQLPLMLAWAVTIHKAQGKTLDRVFVDLGNSAFAAGQVYVALSRVRTLEDLRLARPIREDEVRCDPHVTEFYQRLMRMTQIREGESARRD